MKQMYKRLIIVSTIILTALCGLSWLGYRSIQIRADGMEGTRLGEFVEVAEQIRGDVKRKLDEFMQIEQNRPYTDYQYYYVPENVADTQQQMLRLRSPLGNSIENSFAFGNFQIEPDGKITTPYYRSDRESEGSEISQMAKTHLFNIEKNLKPVLGGTAGIFKPASVKTLIQDDKTKSLVSLKTNTFQKEVTKKIQPQRKSKRVREYRIESLEKESQSQQILTQQRDVVSKNVLQTEGLSNQQAVSSGTNRQKAEEIGFMDLMAEKDQRDSNEQTRNVKDVQEEKLSPNQTGEAIDNYRWDMQQIQQELPQQTQTVQGRQSEEQVQIRIEPFVPVLVDRANTEQSVFGGQVFMLRHVQIENRHLLQGFQLNEKNLLEEIKDSAQRFMREGMNYELSQAQNADAAFAAILNFGFGDLVLNLTEIDPAWIDKQIRQMRNWYLSLIGIVLVAVLLGLASLWRNARAQLKLAQKKDDFISAVSHELRTPLTSIRMYSEMLEKNWVKSEDKVAEYYRNMRQESERLSRLIENVLDFSRIQKGRKKYTFSLGDVNKCIADVVEMMRPYAAQNDFSIKTNFAQLSQTAFDRDAVTQIVVNLLDNAVKYARDAVDKRIIVRTERNEGFIVIEVEDHGPGIPHRQHLKVFEEFYRIGSEATRETNGTGLGLALVKKFAQAHNGFVEILAAKPMGAVFRVGLAIQR